MKFIRFPSFLTILVVPLLLCCAGCGGGTEGSGGTGNPRIVGTVVDPTGQPIGGAQVTIEESGETTVTMADGTFVLEAEFLGGDVNLSITSGEASAMTTFADLPTDTVEVTVVLEFDSDAEQVDQKDVDVKREPDQGEGGKPDSETGEGSDSVDAGDDGESSDGGDSQQTEEGDSGGDSSDGSGGGGDSAGDKGGSDKPNKKPGNKKPGNKPDGGGSDGGDSGGGSDSGGSDGGDSGGGDSGGDAPDLG
jgi:hypothetical protein